MKLSIRQLRKIINEVAMSPSLVKNNSPLASPTANKNIAELVSNTKKKFHDALIKNLVLASWDKHYDAASREFSDAEYERIKHTAQQVSKSVTKQLEEVLNSAWRRGHQIIKQKEAA